MPSDSRGSAQHKSLNQLTNLDLKDRQILFALEQNARQSNAGLSKAFGLAPDVVQYRIDRLVSRGIMKFFLGYVNFARLGYVDYGLFMSMQRLSREQEKSFVEFFINHPNCPYFSRSGGTYDYAADILARDPISLFEIVTEIGNVFGDFIHHQEIITRIDAVHFPKQYLLDACPVPSPSTYFGGKVTEPEKVDHFDHQILRILAHNARAKLVDIAKQVDLSDTAISQRIKRLEDAGVITGYFAWIEPQSFGYQSYNLLVKQNHFRKEDGDELFEFCKGHRHITWLLKTMGRWDFEIGAEVKSLEDLQDVVDDLKDRFSKIIQRIEFAPIFRTIKYTQYPFDL